VRALESASEPVATLATGVHTWAICGSSVPWRPFAGSARRTWEAGSAPTFCTQPFENWVEVIGNECLTGALLDRLTHHIHILEANGPSYRLREAKQQLKKPRGTTPAAQ